MLSTNGAEDREGKEARRSTGAEDCSGGSFRRARLAVRDPDSRRVSTSDVGRSRGGSGGHPLPQMLEDVVEFVDAAGRGGNRRSGPGHARGASGGVLVSRILEDVVEIVHVPMPQVVEQSVDVIQMKKDSTKHIDEHIDHV